MELPSGQINTTRMTFLQDLRINNLSIQSPYDKLQERFPQRQQQKKRKKKEKNSSTFKENSTFYIARPTHVG